MYVHVTPDYHNSKALTSSAVTRHQLSLEMQGSFAIRHLSYSLSTQITILSAGQQYVNAVYQLSCNKAAELTLRSSAASCY